MSLGLETKKTYLNIKDGKIVKKTSFGEQSYDYVEGYLRAVSTVIREINRERLKFWQFELMDEKGETYILSLNYSSGVAKSILNAIANIDEEIKLIKIKPYPKDGFTKVVVYHNGNKLDWKYNALPEVEIVKIGDKEVKDDSKRMAFFEKIAEEIRAKLPDF